ncbi:MAG: hypothetical protein Q3976_00820, partial [Corynebacterium sp.]|nr:hypothetical protein [Corynebacterium sp.]
MGIFDDFKTSLTAETPETQVVNPLGNFGEQQRRLAAEPQSYEQPANGFKPAGQDASAASYPSYPDYSVEEDASLRDQEWIMPEYEGSALYEWIPVIQRAKAENDYEDALTIAYGCMDAMIRVAQENPHNVMDFYVIQLADLYAELGRHDKVIEVISEWLNYNLPAPREDLRLALYKRLAKSQALAVKEAGNSAEICMVYNAEWRRLVEEERTLIENAPDWSHIPITGKALASSKKPVPAAQESSQAGSPETVVPQQLVQAIGAPGQPQPQAPSQPQQAQLQAQQELPQPQAAASFAQIPGNQQPFAQEQFPQPEATQQAAQFNASQYGQEMFGQQSTQFGAPQFGAPQFGAPQFGAPEQSGAPEFEQPQQFGRDPQLRGPEQYGQPQAQQGAQGFGQVPEQLQQPMDFNNQYGAEALSAQHAPNFEEQFAQAGQFGAPAQSQFEASQQFQQAPQFA